MEAGPLATVYEPGNILYLTRGLASCLANYLQDSLVCFENKERNPHLRHLSPSERGRDPHSQECLMLKGPIV